MTNFKIISTQELDKLKTKCQSNFFDFNDNASILLHEGDLTIDTDLTVNYFDKVWKEAGGSEKYATPVFVVNGDLIVKGNVINDYYMDELLSEKSDMMTFDLYVTGNLSCKNLLAGGQSYTLVKGDLEVKHLVRLFYNDTETEIIGGIDAQYVFNYDHCLHASKLLNSTQYFDFRVDSEEKLGQLLRDQVWTDENGINIAKFISCFDSGQSPFKHEPAEVAELITKMMKKDLQAAHDLVEKGLVNYQNFGKNYLSFTPLFFVIWGASTETSTDPIFIEIAEVLLDAGANISITENNQPTPLQYALVNHANAELFDLLMERGADLYQYSSDYKKIEILLLKFVTTQIKKQHEYEDQVVWLKWFKEGTIKKLNMLKKWKHKNVTEIIRVVEAMLATLDNPDDNVINLIPPYKPLEAAKNSFWSKKEKEWQLGKKVNGHPVGDWVYWDNNGRLVCKAHYEGDDGNCYTFTRYHQDGSLACQSRYKNGKQHGINIFQQTKNPSSESRFFPIYDPPKNIFKSEAEYDEGKLLRFKLTDYDGNEVDKQGNPI